MFRRKEYGTMSEKVLNCQGLSCPGPLLRVKEFLDAAPAASLIVVVDNEASRENVCRFLRSRGFSLNIRIEDGPVWRIDAQRDADAPETPQPQVLKTPPAQAGRRLAVLITTPVIGSGDDALGAKLMQNFLSTLPEMGPELWRVILLNGGVRLAAPDSPVLPALLRLEREGAQVLVCGSCLEHFGLLAQKAVGETTNMLDVVTSLQLADSVIRP